MMNEINGINVLSPHPLPLSSPQPRGNVPSGTRIETETEIKNKTETDSSAPWSPGHLHGRRKSGNRRVQYKPTEQSTIAIHNRFYILETLEEDRTLKDACSFRGYEDLKKCCEGEPEDVKLLRNGSMMVKTRNELQSRQIINLRAVAGVRVKATPHKKLNSSQGTVLARLWDKYAPEEICEYLASEGVTDVYKFPSRPGRQYTGSRYLLTFNRLQPPEKIRAGFEKLDVRQYIPRPRRCYNCQGFGHVGKYCRKEHPICGNCSEPAHTERDIPCNKQPLCRNCGQTHPASDVKCPKYRMEQEIITIVTKEKISFYDARQRVKKQYPDKVNSYSEILRGRKQDRSDQNQTGETITLPQRLPARYAPSQKPPSPVPRGEAQNAPPSPKPGPSGERLPRHTNEKRKVDSPPEGGEQRKKLNPEPKPTKIKSNLTQVSNREHHKSLIKDYPMPPAPATHKKKTSTSLKKSTSMSKITSIDMPTQGISVHTTNRTNQSLSRDPRIQKTDSKFELP